MSSAHRELRQRRSSSVTVHCSDIVVPDPSASGRFSVSLPGPDISRPGPVFRWAVLALIGFGIAGMVGYAWVRNNENLGLSENAVGSIRGAPPMASSLRAAPTSL